MPRVTLNGESKDVEAGLTILEALGRSGIHVPHLCHDPRVAPIGACRLCVVEIEGRTRPVAACTTPVAEGMVVKTQSDKARDARRQIEVRAVGIKGPGPAAVITGSGSATHAALARDGAGNVGLSFSSEGGVYVARLTCDDAS